MLQVRTPAQLAPYLKSLRKARGLTQAQLGAQLGVSAARLGVIEQQPGVVGFEQVMRLLHLLGARLVIETSDDRGGRRGIPSRKGEW